MIRRPEYHSENALENFSRKSSEALGKLCADLGIDSLRKNPSIEIDNTMVGMGRYYYKEGRIIFNPSKIAASRYTVEEVIEHEALHWIDADAELQGLCPYSHLLHCAKFSGEAERRLGMAECQDFKIEKSCSIDNIKNLEDRARSIIKRLGENVDDIITNETDNRTILELFFLISAIQCIKEIYFSERLAPYGLKVVINFEQKRKKAIDEGKVRIFSPSDMLGAFGDFDDELFILEQTIAEVKIKKAR